MSEEIKRFPIDGFQRWHNALGKRAVPCIVSNRWFQFPEKSDRFEDGDYPDGDYMFVDAMMMMADGQSRKNHNCRTVSLASRRYERGPAGRLPGKVFCHPGGQ